MTNDDGQLLAATPDFLSIETMLKATPAQEGDRRFIYLEAANEGLDQTSEIVLAKALHDSADHFMRYGNIDIDHKSMPAVAKQFGIDKPELWEIGVPVDVRVDGKSTFVKAELYSGDTPLAEHANNVWDGMTRLKPARRYYPSVGGKVLAKSIQIDPSTGDKVGVVTKVRWTNIAISQHPVNQHVAGVATVPFGVLAKSFGADGFCFTKALEGSHETDATLKTGGAAIGTQSLDTGKNTPVSYYDFRNKLAAAIKSGLVDKQSIDGLVSFSAGNLGLSYEEAAEWVGRFLSDLKSSLKRRGN